MFLLLLRLCMSSPIHDFNKYFISNAGNYKYYIYFPHFFKSEMKVVIGDLFFAVFTSCRVLSL